MVNMTFIKEALKDFPERLYPLENNLADESGYGVAATTGGATTLPTGAALMSGVDKSYTLGPDSQLLVNTKVFKQGQEDKSFSLECWVHIVNPGTKQQLISNASVFDGLTLNGNIVGFSTLYSNTSADITYDTVETKTLHIVGVHTKAKNSLYVNGVVVGEIDLSEAQQASTYQTSNDFLCIGGGSSATQTFNINGVGIYNTALRPEDVARHYEAGRQVSSNSEIAPAFGGYEMPLGLDYANISTTQIWNDEETWNQGTISNLGISNDALVPLFEGATSLPGRWIVSFALDASGDTTLFGLIPNWTGQGMTVESSIDAGSTWSALTRLQRVPNISETFDPAGKSLQIRVSFPGGILNDTAILESLSIIGLANNKSGSLHGRVLTYTGAIPKLNTPIMELGSNSAAEVVSGNISMSPDTSADASPLRTLEVWIKPNANITSSFGLTGTYYQDGLVTTNALLGGYWTLYHIVTSANVTSAVSLNIPGTIGSVSVYPTALTAAQILAIYKNYVEDNALSISPSSDLIQVLDYNPGVYSYSFDWTVEKTG